MTSWWVALLGAAIGAGLLQTIGSGIKLIIGWRRASTPEKIEQQKIHDQVAQADQSIMVVSRSRDALEHDNVRLRQEIAERVLRHAEDNRRHDVERAEWREERAELRREIDAMEDRLQTTLDELQALKQRHGMTGERLASRDVRRVGGPGAAAAAAVLDLRHPERPARTSRASRDVSSKS